MARLTPTEQRRLGLIRPDLMQKLLELLDRGERELGFKLAVPDDGGTRSSARQAQLYAWAIEQGGGQETAYPVGKPGRSRHQYGAAFDLHIVDGGDGPGGHGAEEDYRKLAQLGENIGLVAGFFYPERGVGDRDLYHFNLDESLQQSIDRWEAMKRAGIVRAIAVIALAVGVAHVAGS